MALTHEQAGHLLHPTQWMIEGSPALILVSEWNRESGEFSDPITERWDSSARPNRYTWFAVASVDPSLDPGVGGLFKAGDATTARLEWWGFEAEDISSSNPWLSWVNLASNGTMGGVNGAPPRLNSNQQLEFERLYNDYRYVIRIAGTQLCLTAGPAPSETPTQGSVTLAPYEGASNQIWTCHGSPDLIGFYDLRSYASNGSLVITTPSDVLTNHAQLSLESPRPDSASQTYRIIEPTIDPSRVPHQFFMYQARDPRTFFYVDLPQTGAWTVHPIGQSVHSNDRYLSYLKAPETSIESWTADGIQYPSHHLYYSNYYFDTAGPDRVPFSGGLWGADSYPESPQQSWIPVPRHVYDTSLPTPSGLSVVVDNSSFGEKFETTSRCALSIDPEGTIQPASISLKFSVSGTQELFQISSARGVNIEESISYEPGWGLAWVPSAFSSGVDKYGKITVDAGRIALDTQRTRVKEEFKIRCFRYSASGVPTVGPAASITIDFAVKHEFDFDDAPMVGRDGLEIPYEIRYFTGPTSLHFDSVHIGDVEAIRDFDTSVSSASGRILIPWTAFMELDAAWMRAAGTVVQIKGMSSDLFGTSEFWISRALIADENATVVTGMMASYPFFTSITTLTAGEPDRTFCVVDSERGQHVIEMPYGCVTPPVLDHSAILDGEQQQTSRALRIVGRSILGDDDAYIVASFDIPRPARCVTTLAYPTSAGGITIIAVEGNVSSGFSLSRDVATARRVGANAFELGALPGSSPELELRGVLYRGQLASYPASFSYSVKIVSTIQEACQIPPDTTCVLRTAYGTCHRVRVVGVSVPRSARDQAEITFSLVEVDD